MNMTIIGGEKSKAVFLGTGAFLISKVDSGYIFTICIGLPPPDEAMNRKVMVIHDGTIVWEGITNRRGQCRFSLQDGVEYTIDVDITVEDINGVSEARMAEREKLRSKR